MNPEVNTEVTEEVSKTESPAEADDPWANWEQEVEELFAGPSEQEEGEDKAPAPKQEAPKKEEAGKESLKKEEKKEEPKPEIWKLKVDGEEVDFDPSDPVKVKQMVQKGLAADKRFQESAVQKKQIERFFETLRSNPLKILKDPALGINFREIAESYLYDQIQLESMTPAQRAAREKEEADRAELETLRREEAERREAEAERNREELVKSKREQYEIEINEALKIAGLPNTAWTVQTAAQMMIQARRKGLDPSFKDLMPHVKAEFMEAQRAMLNGVSGQELINLLGKETADKVRSANLENVRPKNPAPAQKTETKKSQPSKQKFSNGYQILDKFLT